MMTSYERIQELLKANSQESDLVWLFTGDSITHGVHHLFNCRDYVQHFEERIRFELDRRYDTVIRTAISGWTTKQILEDIERRITRYNPDVLSIMIGMNDSSTQSGISLENYCDNYNDILNRVAELGNPALILHTPNPVLQEATTIFNTLGQFSQIVRDIARERQAVLVDHYSAWLAETAKSDMSLHYWLNDPIHPNHFGHLAFAHETFRELGIYDPTSQTCRFYKPMGR